MLIGILFINAFISWRETVKAGDAVAALKGSLKPVATVYRDGKWQNIDSALIVPGDLMKVRKAKKEKKEGEKREAKRKKTLNKSGRMRCVFG